MLNVCECCGAEPPDSWDGCGGYYVAWYRNNLDELARQLSEIVHSAITTRFNKQFKCAEFVGQNGQVFAQVNVNGECCSPYKAIVRSDFSADTLELFKSAIPLDIELRPLPVL